MERGLLFGATLALAWMGVALLRAEPPHLVAGGLLLAAALGALVGLPRLLGARRGARAAPQRQAELRPARENPRQELWALARVGTPRPVAQPLSAVRAAGFVAGALLVCAGQLLMLAPDPLWNIPLSHRLNDLFAIGVANPDNALVAAALLLVGAVVAARNAPAPDVWPDALPARAIPRAAFGARAAPAYALLAAALAGFALLTRQLAVAQSDPRLTLLWLLKMALVLAAALLFDRRSCAPLRPDLDRYDLLVMAALLAAGLVIGAYQLDRLPASRRELRGMPEPRRQERPQWFTVTLCHRIYRNQPTPV